MIRNNMEVAATTTIVAISMAASAIWPLKPAMAILGIMLFASAGYVLGKVLIKSTIPGFERFLLTMGLALLVPLMGGLILSAIGIPLQRTAWLVLIAGVILLCDSILVIRTRTSRSDVVKSSRSSIRIPTSILVSSAIAVVIAGTAVGLARVGVAMQRYPGFTELWLSPSAGSTSVASLGVTNHQGSTTRYRLILFSNGRSDASWNITLADGQTWQRHISIRDRLTTVANLYRLPDALHPFRQVRLHS